MTTDQLVSWLLGTGHLEQLDVDARPLGEAASRAYVRAEQDEQVRAFGDSRDHTGLPCNIAALAQLRGHWETVTAWVGRAFRNQPDCMGRVARRAHLATRVAPLLALRGHPVSVEHAALFKTFLGFNEVSLALLLEERVDYEQPALPLDEWVDERPWLIGDRQVCAGTRAQIKRAWEALQADVEGPEPEPWLVAAADACRELEALVAASAGAARVALHRGADPSALGAHLIDATVVPRAVEALRSAPNAGVVHTTLLFEAGGIPTSLRAFIEAIANSRPTDEALLECAQQPVNRLCAALGRESSPLSAAAFTHYGETETAGS